MLPAAALGIAHLNCAAKKLNSEGLIPEIAVDDLHAVPQTGAHQFTLRYRIAHQADHIRSRAYQPPYLARIRVPLARPVFVFVIATLMVPGAATFVPTFVVVGSMGGVNTLWGLIVPGLFNAFLGRFLIRVAPTAVEATTVEHEVGDGETLPDGLRAIHVPGHCAGQLAFLWPRHSGVLIAADAAANVFGLALSPMYEDVAEGRRSLAKLAALEFAVACFGHGRPIPSGASARFRQKWSSSQEATPRAA